MTLKQLKERIDEAPTEYTAYWNGELFIQNGKKSVYEAVVDYELAQQICELLGIKEVIEV